MYIFLLSFSLRFEDPPVYVLYFFLLKDLLRFHIFGITIHWFGYSRRCCIYILGFWFISCDSNWSVILEFPSSSTNTFVISRTVSKKFCSMVSSFCLNLNVCNKSPLKNMKGLECTIIRELWGNNRKRIWFGRKH